MPNLRGNEGNTSQNLSSPAAKKNKKKLEFTKEEKEMQMIKSEMVKKRVDNALEQVSDKC